MDRQQIVADALNDITRANSYNVVSNEAWLELVANYFTNISDDSSGEESDNNNIDNNNNNDTEDRETVLFNGVQAVLTGDNRNANSLHKIKEYR